MLIETDCVYNMSRHKLHCEAWKIKLWKFYIYKEKAGILFQSFWSLVFQFLIKTHLNFYHIQYNIATQENNALVYFQLKGRFANPNFLQS